MLFRSKNEFKNLKNDNQNIKQELIMLKIDKSFDHQQIDNELDEHKDGEESSQQALLSEKGIMDHFQLSPVHKLIPPKWFTKVKNCCFSRLSFHCYCHD